MTITIRPMHDGDAPPVAEMVKGLARDTGAEIVPRLTPENLIASRDLIDVTIAEDEKGLLGACLTLLTYSTWRDAKGLYVVDLFVDPRARNGGVGLMLLREAARRGRAKGARSRSIAPTQARSGSTNAWALSGTTRTGSSCSKTRR